MTQQRINLNNVVLHINYKSDFGKYLVNVIIITANNCFAAE